MRNKIQRVFVIIILSGSFTLLNSQELLKFNPAITKGQLDNGLTYFIQNNKKPENRIELRLVVKAGSIHENDNQRGLAHFVEHMAFNGTENFPKDKLIKYLESLGMGFGPEINAYTSFDETVYQLSVPGDDPDILNNAFLILEDWAHRITMDDEEIEKERGVIVEEWRGGRGAIGRYRDRLFPALFKDSLYAKRLPIGDMDVVKNCDPQLLRDYYQRWYRPDLMAIIVVGDINQEEIEEKIKKQFNFKKPLEKWDRGDYKIPYLDRTDVEIVPDPEVLKTTLSLFIKDTPLVIDSAENYKEYIVQFLIAIMFNGRMEEIYTKTDSPFLSASAGYGSIVKSIGMLSFTAAMEDGKVHTGFEALLDEIEKVKQNGFTEVELNRAKSQVKLIIDNIYNERDNIKSTTVINDIKNYFLKGNVTMALEDEVALLSLILEDIYLDRVNSAAYKSFSGSDKTLAINTPSDSEKLNPKEFKKLFKVVESKKFAQRSEAKIDRELFDKELKSGSITLREYDDLTGITTVKIDNNATIVLKPTDFKADEIMFSAISFGGLSLVEDNEFRSGEFSAKLAKMSGLNEFNSIELDRVLTGKNVSISPWIKHYTEGITGSSNNRDFEVLLQLINLYYTEPEFDNDSFSVLLKNIESSVLRRDNSPRTIFLDRVSELLARGHFRSKPITAETLKQVKFEEAERIYRERFQDPGDFYFVFTGSFSVNDILPLIAKYIGSIPGKSVKEEAKDLGLKFPEGIVKDVVIKGIDDQSVVEIIFNGEFNGTKDNELGLNLLSKYLEEKLRIRIREEMSGTYGVSVFSNIRHYPAKKYAFGVYFGCEPGREEELIEAVFNEIKEIKLGRVDQKVIDSTIINLTRRMELNLKDNGYWHSSISTQLLLGRDFKEIVELDASFFTAEELIYLTNTFINEDRYVRVILKPESK